MRSGRRVTAAQRPKDVSKAKGLRRVARGRTAVARVLRYDGVVCVCVRVCSATRRYKFIAAVLLLLKRLRRRCPPPLPPVANPQSASPPSFFCLFRRCGTSLVCCSPPFSGSIYAPDGAEACVLAVREFVYTRAICVCVCLCVDAQLCAFDFVV